ncbi:hypothetical protein Enr13x_59260 [Stieleria neptunia]|uniref:Uncharacterized protein n=1 Tax=Stieleria neptunia TaxID=2527979 RepID=A0A518HVF9_9BACT|nr:hypothetical protein [Stieleria neptunia]QDV40568.1 hypothetical protein Enr13x_03740 [Stieleria neptunia]QDV41005.1 hypothetical protein Enr13x_08430 [Stieleria neptunia]QDV41954.1 hypothetical protein Enr13x_17970 [Stieleria neptunia]QDV43338.1 hypothetical protein Enr13x_31930 [Stieleria neptunia]QDV43750.1 hypothetical protein Enr13x_36080 [Stieleria neptunia]
MLQATISYRACEKIARTLGTIHSGLSHAPTANTIQNWTLRRGLHELTRPKEQADDWILLVDHTIQLGNEKCLLIVGIRLEHWLNLDRPIRLSDLSAILIEIVQTSNGKIVAEQLKKAADRVGQVKAIISDQGSDLVNGIAGFQQESESTIALTDMCHRTATALKHVLQKDPQWDSFLGHCGKTQPKAKQTELGSLLPPKLKVKARFMNLHSLIGWAERMLRLLDTPHEERQQQDRLGRLEEKFAWVLDYRESIAVWARLMRMVDKTLEHSRTVGFNADSAASLAEKLSCDVGDWQSQAFRDEIVSAIEENSSILAPGERLPASSEILESLIGKGKQMGRQHSRSGFTRNVLSMAASVADVSAEAIETSLASVTHKTLCNWVKDNLRQTMTMFRRSVLPSSPGTDTA